MPAPRPSPSSVTSPCCSAEPSGRVGNCQGRTAPRSREWHERPAAGQGKAPVRACRAAVYDGARRAPSMADLPLAPTPLIGRDAELAEATALLRRDHVRVITL